jgi:hypothetical protein
MSFRYRKCSDIDIRVHSDIRHWRKKKISPCRFELGALETVSERYNITTLWLSVYSRMSDIWYRLNFIPISDIMSDSAFLVRYRKFRYQAQSNFAVHGYRTKCPPMPAGKDSHWIQSEFTTAPATRIHRLIFSCTWGQDSHWTLAFYATAAGYTIQINPADFMAASGEEDSNKASLFYGCTCRGGFK